MAIIYSANPYCCLFYLDDDRLGDRRTVQEHLWQMQCQPSSAGKMYCELYYVTILLCALNKPFTYPLFCLTPSRYTSLKTITVLRFSAIFACRLKRIYGSSFSLHEGSFSMFNDWISTSSCGTLHYPILFLNCQLFWVGAFRIQTGILHPYSTERSSNVDTICKVELLSKGFFTSSLGLGSLLSS